MLGNFIEKRNHGVCAQHIAVDDRRIGAANSRIGGAVLPLAIGVLEILNIKLITIHVADLKIKRNVVYGVQINIKCYYFYTESIMIDWLANCADV